MLISSVVHAEIELNIDDETSIKNAAATIAYDMMTYYKGNQSGGIPGVFTWTSTKSYLGLLLVGIWRNVGDSYRLLRGENVDMMPANWSQSMGNDDQGFWGMTAMSAAETKFPDPPAGSPGWLALAQAVFNTQAVRIDNTTCNGGVSLRWQVYPYLTGYTYKNSIANGCFFNIGARLARYTNNATYADYAELTWEWVKNVGYMDEKYNIYDGAHIDENCAATMYNYTNGSAIWEERVKGLLNATFTNFFPTDQIAYEIACEAKLSCTTDMFSFKAYLTRWLAATTKMAPFTYDLIMPYLKASAVAAAKQCNGPSPFNDRTCGLSWIKGTNWDGTYGVGQQMAAMSAIFVNLVQKTQAPVTNSTGGTSVGNSAAGSSSTTTLDAVKPPSTGDRVGAGMVTTVVLVGMTGMFGWMSL
ncbi:hypothetical protein DID88_009027 [Monilinia fructigena]|uniref:Mannan endo-1,6-alpha-mannosidase n=1 Tax=Monilinia fructigena TaxID=38457 RepID=A0A395IHT8_9HELO|nr:hypothetical protein DID88_009027 [Monilinia fructigena]